MQVLSWFVLCVLTSILCSHGLHCTQNRYSRLNRRLGIPDHAFVLGVWAHLGHCTRVHICVHQSLRSSNLHLPRYWCIAECHEPMAVDATSDHPVVFLSQGNGGHHVRPSCWVPQPGKFYCQQLGCPSYGYTWDQSQWLNWRNRSVCQPLESIIGCFCASLDLCGCTLPFHPGCEAGRPHCGSKRKCYKGFIVETLLEYPWRLKLEGLVVWKKTRGNNM